MKKWIKEENNALKPSNTIPTSQTHLNSDSRLSEVHPRSKNTENIDEESLITQGLQFFDTPLPKSNKTKKKHVSVFNL